MAGMNKLLSVFGLFMLVIIGSVYMFGVLSAENSAVNVTGTEYEEAYNSSVKTQALSSGFVPMIALIIFFAFIIIVVKFARGR